MGARTREIFIVGPSAQSPQLLESLKKHLDNALSSLPGAPFEWSFSNTENPQELIKRFELQDFPLLVLLNPQEGTLPDRDPSWEALCQGIRRLDPLTCILVLSGSESPSSEQSIRWLDRGANGLLNLSAPVQSTEDPLRDMLSLPLRVKVPRKVRMNARHKIELHLASLEQALVAETLNIGLGGLFIRSVPQGVSIGDEVEFVLQFSQNVSGQTNPENSNPLVAKMDESEDTPVKSSQSPSQIRGSGSVVWVRSTPQGDEPEGIGLKFEDVEPDGFKKLQDFIARHRISAFIPKA
jgi:Tfp pilus assembly protein PilZ